MKKSEIQIELEAQLAAAEAALEAATGDEAGRDVWGEAYDAKKAAEKALDRLVPIYEVGDGITENLYSDRHAYTVVEVAKNGKKIKVQRDNAERGDWKPEIIPGGFAGHCTNNNTQVYTYSRNTEAPIITLSLRTKKYRNGAVKEFWVKVGQSTASLNGRTQFSPGRHEKYDYNF